MRVYLLVKLLHIAAVIAFLGNIGTGLFWHAHAAGSRDPMLLGSVLDGIIRSDRIFTVPGVIAIVATGAPGGAPSTAATRLGKCSGSNRHIRLCRLSRASCSLGALGRRGAACTARSAGALGPKAKSMIGTVSNNRFERSPIESSLSQGENRSSLDVIFWRIP
jgi:hypothetical protein